MIQISLVTPFFVLDQTSIGQKSFRGEKGMNPPTIPCIGERLQSGRKGS